MTALLLRLWRQHRLTLSIMSAGLAAFAFILTRAAPAPGELGFLAAAAALIPKQLLAMAGGDLALTAARGVIAFGYVHPFFLTMLSAWTIRVTASALAGELGRGTMGLLAARPIPRTTHVLATWITTVTGLGALVLAAWIGSAIGLQLRPLHVSAREVAVIPLMAWLLFTCWAGISLAISATRREAGPAISWAAGLIATSFVVVFLAQVWGPAEWLRPFSPFAYFRPQEIASLGIAMKDVLTLGVVGLSALALAVVIFRRRDL
jgi:ABC-type transport system involved in multi-copper enzyme maturation permease subunit